MLIAQTRNTNPISSIFLISLFWLLNLGFSFYEVLLSCSNWSCFPFYKLFLANLSILGTSILVNRILQQNKLVGPGDVFSGILFLIFFLGIKDIYKFYGELMSLFLITLGTNRLISLYNVNKNYLREFEVGMLFGLSMLIVPDLFLILIVIFIGIRLVIPYTWRDFIAPLLGCFCVFCVKYSLLFISGMWTLNLLPNFSFSIPKLDVVLDLTHYFIALLLFFCLIVLYKVITVLKKRSIKDRIFYWLWIWTLIFLLLSMIFLNEGFEKSYLIISLGLPCSIFGTEFFPKKRKLKEYWKKEILIYLLILIQFSLRIY
jgi:hypothetical protein